MKKHLFAFSVIMMAIACNDKPSMQVEPSQLLIEPVITRATEVNFEAGDAIGVDITTADGAAFASNAKLTYTDAAFSGEQKWYADGGQTCSVYAYYPYSASGFPTSFTVGTDQSAGAGAYDLMVASKAGVTPQAAPVTMVFKHQLTQVVMNVTNTAGAEIESVVFKGLLPTVNLNKDDAGVVSAVVDESASKVDIVSEAVVPGVKYRAIVAPQTMSFGVSVKIKSGASVVENFTEVTMQPGYTYAINAEVLTEGIRFSLAGEIEAWQNGGTLNPDDSGSGSGGSGSGSFEEGEGYFVYGGLRYNTVKLANGSTWMAEPLAYLPAGLTVSEDPASGDVWYPYSSDGTNVTLLKDDASIKANGYLYSYNALLNATIDESNFDRFEGTQGICPEGWHIPTRAEWYALCGNSNASKYLGESGTQLDATALFWDSTIGYATVSAFNAAGFNFTLSGCIGNSKYNTLICDSSLCAVPEFIGKNRMAYVASSSPNSATQFFALMTTFTSVNNYGKVSLSFATLGKVGVQVRCTKD